ncbi:MAG: hypothetical protein ACRENS_02330 [Candidatus Eiseniibacteriota bacterium]
MKRTLLLSAGLLAMFAAGARADASSALAGSPLALQPLQLNALVNLGETPITLETVGYRPRSPHPNDYHPHASGPPGLGSQTQIHGGFFTPQGGSGQGFVLGLRGGPMVSENVQLGVAMDWEHRSNQGGNLVGSSNGPGGTVIVTRQVVNSSENTFPLLAFLQLAGSSKRAIVPYLGVGGGYEIVSLYATDYLTSTAFSATYGGWGWQSWAGLRIPFAGHSGLLAEGYMNRATAYRDVYDPYYGMTLRESVNLSGYGGRFGLSWGL